MSDDPKIAGFPKPEVPPQEMVRRQRLEAERLARLSPGEWQLWIDRSAEQYGTTRATLEASVKAIIAEREKAERERKAEAAREQRRVERRLRPRKRTRRAPSRCWIHYRRLSRKNASTNWRGASMRTRPRCARNSRHRPCLRSRARLNCGPRRSTAPSCRLIWPNGSVATSSSARKAYPPLSSSRRCAGSTTRSPPTVQS